LISSTLVPAHDRKKRRLDKRFLALDNHISFKKNLKLTSRKVPIASSATSISSDAWWRVSSGQLQLSRLSPTRRFLNQSTINSHQWY